MLLFVYTKLGIAVILTLTLMVILALTIRENFETREPKEIAVLL
jgi:hypothetical protein